MLVVAVPLKTWAWWPSPSCLPGLTPCPPLPVSAGHRSDAIYSALYDGTGHIEVLRGHEYLSHPFAVTLYGGEVYWTDWRTNTLAKANKWTGHNVTVVQRTNTQPFDLQVYHPSRQPLGEAWQGNGSGSMAKELCGETLAGSSPGGTDTADFLSLSQLLTPVKPTGAKGPAPTSASSTTTVRCPVPALTS